MAKPSIAVLPFTNSSGDPKQEFLLASDLIWNSSALSLIAGIELLAHSTAADFQLTGSVRAASGQIRVTARLVEAAGRRTASGWPVRRPRRRHLRLAGDPPGRGGHASQIDQRRLRAASDGQTSKLAAWERCVVANEHHERWSEADNRRARDPLREALEIDPDYVEGVGRVRPGGIDARFYIKGGTTVSTPWPRQNASPGAGAVPRHSQRDDVSGYLAWLRDRHDEAITLCRRASNLSPSDGMTLGFFGVISIFSGDLPLKCLQCSSAPQRPSPQTFTWIDFHIGHVPGHEPWRRYLREGQPQSLQVQRIRRHGSHPRRRRVPMQFAGHR